VLLRREGDAHQQAGERQGRGALPLGVAREQEARRDDRQHHEVGRVRREAQHPGAEREHRVGAGRRDGARRVVEELPRQQEYEHDGQRVHEQQPEVDRRGALAAEGHEGRVGEVGPRQPHVVGVAIRRNALEHPLGRVGEAALVALERHVHQPHPHERHDADHPQHTEPGQQPGRECLSGRSAFHRGPGGRRA
jgi:hypothetical protein